MIYFILTVSLIFLIIDIIFRKFNKKFFFKFFIFFIFSILIYYIYMDFEFNDQFYLYILYLILFYIFYLLIMTGIKNTSPSLYIIHLIVNNKNNIKNKFLKQNFTKKRIYENYKQDLLQYKNNYILTSKGYFILFFFNLIKKLFL